MSADAFLDTNILVYATLTSDPRSQRATALLADGAVLSVQVLNEFANVAARKLRRSWPDIQAALAIFAQLCTDIRPVTLATHQAAIDLAASGGLAFYDALIVASALQAGCTTLFSEDMQDGRVIDGRLTIRNPFREFV